jgi:hypothetical protein
MDAPSAGDLVTIATGGPQIDGIVVETPSATKAVVALVDRTRGPVLRTLDRATLTLREEAGDDDRALQLLIRRTPRAAGGGARGGAGPVSGRTGHTRATMHRTTGK